MKHIHFRDALHRQIQFNLVEQQIRPWQVSDVTMLDVLLKLPRDYFVPDDLKKLAFMDCDIALISGFDGHILASMPAPKIEARLVQAVAVSPKQTVAVVGANSPFLIGVLLALGANVAVFEASDAVLARVQVQIAGLSHLKIHATSFIAHHKDDAYRAKFDALIFCAALTRFEDSYLTVLKPEGKAVAVVGRPPAMTAYLYSCSDQKPVEKNALFDTCLPYLTDAPREPGFYF